MADSMTWGYGSAGRFGFQTGDVLDRFHHIGHGGFFDESFIVKYWVPLIAEGKVVEGSAERPRAAWWIRLLTRFRLRNLLILVAVVIGAYYLFR